MALSAEMHGEIAGAIFHGDGTRAAEAIARHIPLAEAKNAKRLRKTEAR
jgi:DNA-binding FadR family transcriptional regulator